MTELSEALNVIARKLYFLEVNVKSLVLVNDELHEKINAVEEALKKHRKEVFVTCPEDCFCWSVEAALTGNKKEG